MSLTERLTSMSLLGAEWVLWLLLLLSIASVAVMVERALFLRGRPLDLAALQSRLPRLLAGGQLDEARKLLGEPVAPEARVALSGIDELDRGRSAVADAMAAAKSRERLAMERYLGILGTLGNNAPFIGLFGTVLGIIKAFSDLAKNQTGGAGVVMSGISEALVATAVGLLVAIPAVVAFNVFQGKIRRAMARIDAVAHLVLSSRPEATADASVPANNPERAKAMSV